MRSKHITYLPITSIVIGIVVLAVAVTAVSYRDIRRGREQVSDMLAHQARGLLLFTGADIRASLSTPTWRLDRIHRFFREAPATADVVDYLALLDEEGRVVVHTDSSMVGSVLPEEHLEEVSLGYLAGREGRLPSRRPGRPVEERTVRLGRRVVAKDGLRLYEYRMSFDVYPFPQRMTRGMGRGMVEPGMPRVPDPGVIEARLSELLGRPVDILDPPRLTAVVGLDGTDLEAAFHASRNYTLLLSGILLLIGGAAIYFLFMTAHYRSTRTALENMRSYTSNIIESMASGLVSLDADGRVATVNSGARAMLGLGGGNLKGKAVADVLNVEPETDLHALESVMAGGRELVELETRVIGRTGAIPVALSASSLRDEDGERSGTVVLFQDLSETEALKEAVERERHLASLGRLAAGVAHEVRNPLSSLKGFAQFFRSKFRPGSEEERYSEIMIEEVERLDRVVQELLDFARPVTPDRKPVDPNTLIDEALSLVSEDAQFKRVEIVRKPGSDLPRVMVDPLQMRQAVLNVLLNSLEAMADGGTLTIETGVSRGEDGLTEVRIDLTDTGVGMTPEELAKLFEPFYTTKPKGTGLGLTVVSRVLEQNGGRIDVTSTEGEGTTFSLLLPVAGED
jgi:two-component system sensor histidine kinase HydH